MHNMDILILGGTGAMGKNVVDILHNKLDCKVYVTSRSEHPSYDNVCYIKCNAMNWNEAKSVIEKKNWSVILDFMIYRTECFNQRIHTFLNNCEHYFFFASARVYADSKTPITERSERLLDVIQDEEYLKTDEYALSKAREEDILRSQNKKNWTIIRPYITYDVERLQLGVYEKEDWLYRALQGRTIVFDENIANKETALTTGYDVALRITALFLNSEAYGETFHITTQEHHKWKDILSLYCEILEKSTGKKVKVKLIPGASLITNNFSAQVKYDRMYDRIFDNSKINSITGMTNYITLKEGISANLNKFLLSPKFKNFHGSVQARMDRMSKEWTKLSEIKGLKQKLIYVIVRLNLKK